MSPMFIEGAPNIRAAYALVIVLLAITVDSYAQSDPFPAAATAVDFEKRPIPLRLSNPI